MITFERIYPRYHGNIIKPFNEADSLVIQVMYACAHGKCIFCGSYMGKSFRLRPLEYIHEDINGVETTIKAHVTRVFLSDGDVLALPLTRMLDILDALRVVFPKLQRVSAFATPHSLLPLTLDELREMREHGLELLYVGLESGDDETLALSGRGLSSAQQVRAFLKAKQSGMGLSVNSILGLAGTKRSTQHARSTALAFTAIDPDYIDVTSLMPEPGTRLAEAVRGGQFTMPGAATLLQELRLMVEEMRVTRAQLRTNHAPHYLDASGTMPEDKGKVLAAIDAVLAQGELPPLEPSDLRGL